jgi:hypothetical protein
MPWFDSRGFQANISRAYADTAPPDPMGKQFYEKAS